MSDIKQSYVYIFSNLRNSVLYIGVTADLIKRVWEHKNHHIHGFTARYNVTKLVYCETFDDIENAIAREKQLKGGSREKKIKLIESKNPEWKDMYSKLQS